MMSCVTSIRVVIPLALDRDRWQQKLEHNKIYTLRKTNTQHVLLQKKFRIPDETPRREATGDPSYPP